MSIHSPQSSNRRDEARGLSLIELLVFIVVAGIALISVVTAMNFTTRHSADPVAQKQALAIAEALLEEVESMPFFNDCTSAEQYDILTATCQPAVKARGSTTAPYDNVVDYNNFTLIGGDHDIGNSGLVTVPRGYMATVHVDADGAFGVTGSELPLADVFRITVEVSYNGGSVKLEGYRTKYATTLTF